MKRLMTLLLVLSLLPACGNSKGDAGAAGTPGTAGATGSAGSAGATGSPGPVGATGPAGAASTSGTSDLPAPLWLVVAPGDATNTLNWGVVQGAASYVIQWTITQGYGLTGSETWQAIAAQAPPYTHTGLVNGGEYYYVVSAVDSSGAQGDYSMLALGYPAAPPPPPAQLAPLAAACNPALFTSGGTVSAAALVIGFNTAENIVQAISVPADAVTINIYYKAQDATALTPATATGAVCGLSADYAFVAQFPGGTFTTGILYDFIATAVDANGLEGTASNSFGVQW